MWSLINTKNYGTFGAWRTQRVDWTLSNVPIRARLAASVSESHSSLVGCTTIKSYWKCREIRWQNSRRYSNACADLNLTRGSIRRTTTFPQNDIAVIENKNRVRVEISELVVAIVRIRFYKRIEIIKVLRVWISKRTVCYLSIDMIDCNWDQNETEN